ncbi:CPBP family intramembrane glutamic endopeptidase [Arthrobacter sp. B1805]|uniref:CPBP family intramembrane glutamic endopeptidase n=1 Tax=Arthrobacter sp. B1805 TaxID=2058892 RepID=UPI000CE30C66|nr:CPBP family intramembrane glutamic endopeptidase [Arthrobacter sp. B1805]
MEQVDRQFEFHRLARSWPRYRWWRPLLTALLGMAFYLAFTVVLLLVGIIAALATSADLEQYMEAAATIDLSNPVIFAFTLISLILMIPALALATLIVGPKPIGLLSSVAGRIRWGWLSVCTLVATAVFLVSLAVSTVIGFFFPEEAVPLPAQPDTSTLLIMLALSILAVPFQAAAEEYVFRGFLMQAIGSWLRHPAFAILLPVPLFVLGHGYDPLGQTDVAIFAIFAGWISWRTGGLEAAIAVHAINNMTIFVLGAFGLVDVNSTEGSVSGLIISGATMAVTAVVIIRLANRRGIGRTRTVSPEPPQAGYPFPAAPFPGGAVPPAVASGPGAPGPVAFSGPWATAQGPRIQDQQQAGQPLAGPYEPSQYDRSHAPGPGAPPVPVIPRTLPAQEQPAEHGSTAAPPAPSSSDGRDYRADRHPSGPAHPAGPGYPPGTPHPAGPGHPGSDPSTNGPADGQEDQPRG